MTANLVKSALELYDMEVEVAELLLQSDEVVEIEHLVQSARTIEVVHLTVGSAQRLCHVHNLSA